MIAARRRDNWEPTAFGSGLKLWLRADRGIVGPANAITAWRDQSGNGNDANVVVGSSPIWTPNTMNGRPGVTFAGGQGLISTGANLVAANAPRTTFMIVAANAVGSGVSTAVITYRRTLGIHQVLSGAFGVDYVYTGLGGPNATATGIVHTVNSFMSLSYNGNGLTTGLAFTQNGVAKALAGTGTVENDNGASGYALGAGAVNDMTGTTCEIFVVDSVVSAADLARAYTYAKNRYYL